MDQNPYQAPKNSEMAALADIPIPDDIAKKIRYCWIAGLVSAGITVLLIFLAQTGVNPLNLDAWSFADVGIILGLSYGVYKQSRVCAALLLAFFILNKVIMWYESGRFDGIFMAIIFFVIYYQGMIATFTLHKLRTQAVP